MNHSSKKIFLFPATMLGITAISGTIAMMTSVSADDLPSVDDNIAITVDSACTMGQTVLQSGNTLNPGETSTIGQSRIAAYCNDGEGYAIYAIGYTNSEYGNTNLVSTSNSNYTIPTGTSGSSSYWNMKLTQGTATGPVSYQPTMVNTFTTNTTIPDDYTKVAYRDSSTIPQTEDPTTTGSYFTSTYEAHIDTTQPAGIYNGQVQYVMVHPSSAPAPEKPIIPYMQTISEWKGKLLPNVGDTVQAIDQRDGKEYWIAKMADGKIWMAQNLDLDIDSTKTYTPADTDVTTSWTPENNIIIITGAYVSDWKSNHNSPYSADPGELYIYSSGTTDDDAQYTSLADCQDAHSDCSMHNHAGNYYNWSAAIASNDSSNYTEPYSNAETSICPAGWRLPTGRDSNNTAASREWNALLVAEDIMNDPTGTGYAIDGFDNIRTAPLWLVRTGDLYYDGWWYTAGYYGEYWSSTVNSSYNACALHFTSGNVIPVNIGRRDNGYSVRCLAK